MNFRRWIIVLAALTLFAGLASAQFQNLATINCSVTSATPNVRSEGTTEKVGDVLISCGNATTPPTAGSAVDRGTLLVDFGAAITSRSTANVANVGKPSEIVLLFDEPGAGNGPVLGYGQNAAASVCTAAQAQSDQAAVIAANNEAAPVACPAFLKNVVNAIGSYWVLDLNAAGNGGQAANVYQGAIGGSSGITFSGNQVMFYDVPVLPSGAGNLTHLFRISNVRLTPGALANITATLTSNTLAVGGAPVTGARWQYAMPGNPIVGAASSSLTTSVASVGGASLCTTTALNPSSSQSKANMALLTFKENFSNAFKTATLALPSGVAAGEATGSAAAIAAQIQPGGSYGITVGANSVSLNTTTSESSVILPGALPVGLPVGAFAAGQATSGTRLKAVIKNLDPNATYFVSKTPVIDFSSPVTFPNNPLTAAPGLAGDATPVAWAVLQDAGTGGVAPSETAVYTPSVAATTVVGGAGGVPVVQITRSTTDNSATVVWEVTNTVPGAAQSITFALYAVYSNTVTPPTVGNTATVQLGYAPTTASSGAASTAIPRFAAPSSTAAKFFNVLPCQTTLLFPFVTNQAGFETGIAIANTSTDPFGTQTSAGTCALNFYGANQPGSAVAIGAVATGTTFANTTSGLGLVNFQGYMIGVCNFQFAHGFAFIQGGSGPSQMAMGYLPMVIEGSTRGTTLLGESLNQ